MLRVRLLSDDGREDVRQSHTATVSVGRSAENDIRIDQPTVSSQHLRILSGLVVADCGSLNGTFIDGERLKGARLVASGTEIELGGTSTRLIVERTDGPQSGVIDHTHGADQTIPAEAVHRRRTALRAEETADLASANSASGESERLALERDEAREGARKARLELEQQREQALAARAEVARAQGQLEVFKQELDRLRSSAFASSGADGELDRTRGELEQARGALAAAQAELSGVRDELELARGTAREAERAVEAARDAEAAAGLERERLDAELALERAERIDRTQAHEELVAAHEQLQRDQAARSEEFDALRRERDGLLEQRDALERELREERERRTVPQVPAGFGGAAIQPAEPASGGALFAHLNQQIQRQQQKISELEAFKAAAGGDLPPRDGGRAGELERELVELRVQLEAARAAAEQAQAASQVGVEAVTLESFRQENVQLRKQNDELGAQLEVARERLAAAQRAGAPPAARPSATGTERLPAPPGSDPSALEQARKRIAELEQQLRSSAVANRPSPAVPARPAFAGDAAHLWEAFATQDVENREPLLQAPAVEFMTLEMLRVVRKVERVATRVAQDAIGNIPRETLLPGHFDNLRILVARVLQNASDMEARRALVDHTRQLTRWLLVSVAAQRKAAERLVDELRERLSEHTLIASAPLSAKARFVGKETELWRRAARVLTELTPAYLEDRLDELARNEASKLLQES